LYIRDTLVSNRINKHVEYGGQYDPHYNDIIYPGYKMCSPSTRTKIWKYIQKSKYDDYYILFRTNKTDYKGRGTQKVTGYYLIDKEKSFIDPEYNSPTLYAKEAKFVFFNDAIDISHYTQISNNYQFPIDTESKKNINKLYLSDWLNKIKEKDNYIEDYINETNTIQEIFLKNEFYQGIYKRCIKCTVKEKCPLIYRIKNKKKLYERLPNDIADRINKYYNR